MCLPLFLFSVVRTNWGRTGRSSFEGCAQDDERAEPNTDWQCSCSISISRRNRVLNPTFLWRKPPGRSSDRARHFPQVNSCYHAIRADVSLYSVKMTRAPSRRGGVLATDIILAVMDACTCVGIHVFIYLSCAHARNRFCILLAAICCAPHSFGSSLF